MSDDRLPPDCMQQERATLGVILRENGCLAEVESVIAGPLEFRIDANQKIYRAVSDLIHAGKPADIVTVSEWLKARGYADDVRPDYLVDLWDLTHSTAQAGHYAAIVHGYHVRRSLIAAAHEIAESATHLATTPEELLTMAEEKIFSISCMGTAGEITPQADVVRGFLEDLDRRCGKTDTGEVYTRSVETGWADLDRMIGGLHNGEMTVLAARPSVGKTMLGLCLVRNAAGRGVGSLVASLEQKHVELASRMFSRDAKVASHSLRAGMIDLRERERILDAEPTLSGLPVWYDDASRQNVARISANARRLKMRKQLGLIMVDYIGLVDGGKGLKRWEEVGQIARQLRSLAREMDVPILLLAQLNREVESRAGGRPKLSDLRDSGEIEQHADTVLLLHTPDEIEEKAMSQRLEVIVAKNRNGPRGSMFLHHNKEWFDLCNAAREYEWRSP